MRPVIEAKEGLDQAGIRAAIAAPEDVDRAVVKEVRDVAPAGKVDVDPGSDRPVSSRHSRARVSGDACVALKK